MRPNAGEPNRWLPEIDRAEDIDLLFECQPRASYPFDAFARVLSEELLANEQTGGDPEQRQLLELVHRNGLRLQRLVNTLLDFSRIEAGRVQAVYEPTDLSLYTAELAGSFRSAMEKAGLEFRVECGQELAPVYVDPDMWEKIVLNLLSNALKFTFRRHGFA